MSSGAAVLLAPGAGAVPLTLEGLADWNGSTERVAALRYRDWKGENQLRTLGQLAR